MAGNRWKLLVTDEMDKNCGNWLEWLEMAGNGWNG